MKLIEIIRLAETETPSGETPFVLMNVRPSPTDTQRPFTDVQSFQAGSGLQAIDTWYSNETALSPRAVLEDILDHAERVEIEKVYLRVDPSMASFC